MPQSGADVPDDLEARLVVLDTEHPYSKEAGNLAEAAAKSILESRGNAPRLYRNTLVFLAADKTRLQDLDEAVRERTSIFAVAARGPAARAFERIASAAHEWRLPAFTPDRRTIH